MVLIWTKSEAILEHQSLAETYLPNPAHWRAWKKCLMQKMTNLALVAHWKEMACTFDIRLPEKDG